MSKPIFHLNLLKNYQVINIPGTYYVNVAYTITEKNLIMDVYPRYLVPLRVITPKGLEEILSYLIDDKKVVPFKDVREHFLTGVLWFGDILEEQLPIKGEKVLATFDLKDNKLTCTHIELLPREELDYVDIDNLISFRKMLTDLIRE